LAVKTGYETENLFIFKNNFYKRALNQAQRLFMNTNLASFYRNLATFQTKTVNILVQKHGILRLNSEEVNQYGKRDS